MPRALANNCGISDTVPYPKNLTRGRRYSLYLINSIELIKLVSLWIHLESPPRSDRGRIRVASFG